MKVKDLILLLSKQNPNADIIMEGESSDHGARIPFIADIEIKRLDDGLLTFEGINYKFGISYHELPYPYELTFEEKMTPRK